jgi:hypothetical protein
MIQGPAIAVSHFVTQDNLGRPSVFPDSFIVGHQDMAPTAGLWSAAAEVIGKGSWRAPPLDLVLAT